MTTGNFISMGDGIELYAPLEEGGRGTWAIFSHGIGEHRGRHRYLREILGPHYNLLRYDLRGHGLSLGPRGTIDHFSHYARDLADIISHLRTSHQMNRYILLGHSMGALITCDYLGRFATPDFYPEKFFITAPPVGFPGILGALVDRLGDNIFKKLSSYCPPSFHVGGLVDIKGLSHDPKVREHYLEDGLCQKSPCFKLFIELARASKSVFSAPLRVRCPSFVAYGTADPIVDGRRLDHYFGREDSSFEVCRIEGGLHELHNEIEKYRAPYLEFLKEALL